MIVAAYMVAGSVVLILLGMLAAVGFDKGMRSRDFIVFEILVALIMLAILAAFLDRGVAQPADRRELMLISHAPLGEGVTPATTQWVQVMRSTTRGRGAGAS